MIFTVFGEAGGPDTAAAHYNRYGQLTEACSYRSLALELPEGGAPVDLDHDDQHRVGQVVYAELDSNERLRTVAVVEDLDLEAADEEVFFSPLLLMTGPRINERSTYIATSAELHGLALTLRSARVGAQPVEWLSGDIRRRLDRGSWPASWQYFHPLLERAHAQLGDGYRVEGRVATRITDKRPREDEYPPLLPGTWVSRGSRTLPNGLLRGPHGRIISVR